MPSISTTGAILKGIDYFGAKKLAVATPYTDGRNALLKRYLESQDYEIEGIKGLGIEKAADIARLPWETPYELATEVARQAPEAEAITLVGRDGPTYGMDAARLAVRLTRQAIEQAGRAGRCAVAFSIN